MTGWNLPDGCDSWEIPGNREVDLWVSLALGKEDVVVQAVENVWKEGLPCPGCNVMMDPVPSHAYDCDPLWERIEYFMADVYYEGDADE